MHRLWISLFLFVLAANSDILLSAESANNGDSVWEIESLEPGNFDYNLNQGKVILNDRFRITFKEQGESVFVIANKGQLDQSTGEIFAEGNVTLQSEDRVFTSDKLYYNFQTRSMQTDNFRAGQAPFFVEGINIKGDANNNEYSAQEVLLTSDDRSDPLIKLRTRSLSISPGKYLEAKGATFYAGNVPIFYFPYYRRRLDQPPNQWSLTPGYRSRYGMFFEGSYNWNLSDRLSGAAHLDYRSLRGLAGGLDVDYDLGLLGQGDASVYILNDRDPQSGARSRSGSTEFTDRTDRHRLNIYHSVNIETNFTAKLLLQDQSDEFMNRDFFESDFRRDPQPQSHIEVAKHWQNFSISLLAQPQVDDFYQTIERLPELRLTGLRQRLGETPIFYESETSIGYFEFSPVVDHSDLSGYEAFRGDTHQQLLLPRNYFNWLNVVPYAGFRFSHYSSRSSHDSDFGQMNDLDRSVFNTGVEFSFKASNTWPDAKLSFLDVDGLRHVMQPMANYVFVPDPNKRPWEIPQFDRELHSLRLRPIDFPDYNSIDTIDSRNVLRIGVRNRLQTKRFGLVDDVLNWELFTDWRLETGIYEDRFNDIYSNLEVKPRSWLLLGSELRYDPNNRLLNESNHTISLLPNNKWSLTLGHRYLRDWAQEELKVRYPYDPFFENVLDEDWRWGNNLLYTRLYYRINEEWGFRMIHQFEASDGTMEEQSYSLYRDFSSVTSALRFRLRDHRAGKNDFSVSLLFSLKAIPRISLGDDSNRLETQLYR